MVKLKQAETEGNAEDIEYYSSLITDVNELIGEKTRQEDVLN